MIIECPACTTRYDIKATIPPEGRTVRCAKCGTVWRAMPDAPSGAGDDRTESHDAASPSVAANVSESERRPNTSGTAPASAFQREWADSRIAQVSAEEERSAYASNASVYEQHQSEAESQDYGANFREGASFPLPQDGVYAESGHYPEEAPPEIESHQDAYLGGEAGHIPERGFHDNTRQDPDPAQDRETGKVRWFGSFRRKSNAQEKKDVSIESQSLSRSSVAETIPFPRSGLAEGRNQAQAPEEELRTLEEAREAVRNVFSSLADVRTSGNVREFSTPVTQPQPAVSQLDYEQSHGGWASEPIQDEISRESSGFAVLQGDHSDDRGYYQPSGQVDSHNFEQHERETEEEWNGLDAEGDQQSAEAATHEWSIEEEDAASAAIEEAGEESPDPDADLRNAMRAQQTFFEREATDQGDGEEAGAGLAQELETHLRTTPSSAVADVGWQTPASPYWKRPALPLDELADRETLVEDESQEIKEDDAVFDQRLYREIEETQDHFGEPRKPQRRGGLALAAAWGLFLCAAGGLIAGLLAFRDIAADAMPGLAPLYRSLGVPVTVQPLIFESVQYDWRVTENKPALVISGSVYNRSQRKVKVPEFFITIKDQDPALDREYSANLQVSGSKIKSDKRADFEIELLSPNPTITAVELELRNVH